MNKSESIVNLSAALHACQGEMGGVAKNSANPFFKSSYADLTAVLKAAKPVWHAHGITVIQHPHSTERGAGVCTLVMHTSGEWIEHEFTLPLTKSDPQAAGSAITYARRYSLQALALIPTVDDDAEAAMLRSEPVRDEYGRKVLSEHEFEEAHQRLFATIDAIKSAVERDDALAVVESWLELDEDEKIALWKPESKGGPFSTAERKYIRDCASKTPEQLGIA